MNYCIYVALSAENLQFYLWLLDYKKRFHAVSESEKLLSPHWTYKDQEKTVARLTLEARNRANLNASQIAAGIHINTDLSLKRSSPSDTPPSSGDSNALTQAQRDDATPWAADGLRAISSRVGSINTQHTTPSGVASFATNFSASTIASDTFGNAGLNEPCTYSLLYYTALF